MSFFVFRTALPFGYGAFALVLVCVAAFGLVQGWRGLRARPLNRVRALTGLALLILAGFVTAANLVYEDSVELNPVVSVADLKGVWRDGPAVLDLGSDGTYSCSGAGNCNSAAPADGFTTATS